MDSARVSLVLVGRLRLAMVGVAAWFAVASPTAAPAAIHLGQFTLTTSIPALPGASAVDFSGITYSATTGTLLIVDNRTQSFYEYTPQGQFIRSIPSTGFDDLEGITWIGGDQFAVAEERRAHLSIVTIAPTTTSIVKPTGVNLIRPDLDTIANGIQSINPTGDNFGLEGIAYDFVNTFYVAKEKRSPSFPTDFGLGIYSVNRTTGAAQLLFNPAALNGGSVTLSSLATDLSDLYYESASGHLFALSQESHRIIEVTTGGRVLSSLDLAFGGGSGGQMLEGLTFSPAGELMFVGGEPREFRVYSAPVSSPPVVPEPCAIVVWAGLFGLVGAHATCRRIGSAL